MQQAIARIVGRLKSRTNAHKTTKADTQAGVDRAIGNSNPLDRLSVPQQ
ncbi:hypothetical protein P7L53_12125 [Thermoleptolyngbya sichuanensis XZ-Cy5]|nr:hypothetical protein [Thermoleptolyngbya sichuanensis]MDG2616987.1 hypothetical protein [Thermoleptolyngbya sichuanensis XZ-Cy5]